MYRDGQMFDIGGPASAMCGGAIGVRSWWFNTHSSNFQLTQSLAVARGVTYDCPRIAKAGAALALGPRVSVARTHVLPTLRRVWWLAGRQQAAPLPGEPLRGSQPCSAPSAKNPAPFRFRTRVGTHLLDGD